MGCDCEVIIMETEKKTDEKIICFLSTVTTLTLNRIAHIQYYSKLQKKKKKTP